MAKQEATLILKVKKVGDKAIGGITGALGKLNVAIAAVVASAAAMAGVFFTALKASKFKEVQTAFTNMATKQGQDSQAMLANMKKLSAGTVSDLELMKQANNALLLGLPVERFGDMLKIARSSAKATGQSMEFMLQSITTGLGRQSKLMLDNLGILVSAEKANKKFAASLGIQASALTEAQRKTAFINEALRIGVANTEAAGLSGDSLNDTWQRLKASTENLAIALGVKLIPIIMPLVTGLVAMADATTKIFTTTHAEKVEDLHAAIKRTKSVIEGGTEAGTLFGEALDSWNEKLERQIETLDRLQGAMGPVFLTAKELRDRELADLAAKAKAEAAIDKKRNAQKKKDQEELIKSRGSFLAHMSSLQSSHNSTLATVGKAAAIAQITIATGKAAMDGFAWGMSIGGPALGAVFQGLAYAAGAANIAQVAGVELAEGGIVRATPGGVPAIIGEGGRDEAVIPLDDDSIGGGMGTVNITVNGNILGDESAMEEFVTIVDEKLLNMRQNNSSVSFDSGLI